MNICDCLSEHARLTPQRPAIEDRQFIVTYHDLEQQVIALVDQFGRWGLAAGDMVAVRMHECPEHIAAVLALARMGICINPLHGQLTQAELGEQLAGYPLKGVLVGKQRGEQVALYLLSPAELLGREPRTRMTLPEPGDTGASPALFALQSSGTTGRPKRLLLNHQQIAARFATHIRGFDLREDERYLAVIHCSFFAGLRRCLMMIYLGATVVLNRAQSAPDLYRQLQARRITLTSLTPSHLRKLLAEPRSVRPFAPDLKVGVSTGAISEQERDLTRRLLSPQLIELYGSNEVGAITIAGPLDRELFPATVGRAVRGMELQIVDEQDQPLPANVSGEIRCRHAWAPTAYWDDPEASARYFREGWFYPGDLGRLNESGYLFFEGRSDDLINNEGAKFYPLELENVLRTHPDVAEAAVIPWSHSTLGQVAAAFVEGDQPIDKESLYEYCKRSLAAYKCPAAIMQLSALPRNPMGKILKRELAVQLEKYMDSGSSPNARD